MSQGNPGRVVIGGLAGDTGKSLVTLGLVRALRDTGLRVAPFKKGPDFIDASWLGAAAGVPGRNLDTFLMRSAGVLGSIGRADRWADVMVVEGNRGLFDGVDARGSHSTARLAKLIRAPVVLVVNATKATRTVAAMVMGCQALDPELPLAGVILNRVGTARQERVIREAIAGATNVPVLGAIPRIADHPLPHRHLGLLPPAEHGRVREAVEVAAQAVARHVDVPQVLTIAGTAPALPVPDAEPAGPVSVHARIGVMRDEAFSFYYPENLEALESAGAELVPISPLFDTELPAVDALYIGGGFPEVHAQGLSRNSRMRATLARRIEEGLVVWAECGGLMYLGRTLRQGGETFDMVGALPTTIEHTTRPQGHGYVVGRVDHPNPFLREGTTLRGHEFHYSRLVPGAGEVPTVMALGYGVGVGGRRDGLSRRNVVAGYTHLHALGTPQWAPRLVEAAAGGGA